MQPQMDELTRSTLQVRRSSGSSSTSGPIQDRIPLLGVGESPRAQHGREARRCRRHGPCSRSALMVGSHSPCGLRRHMRDTPYPSDPYTDLCAVFARIEAALIAGSVASPPTMARAVSAVPRPLELRQPVAIHDQLMRASRSWRARRGAWRGKSRAEYSSASISAGSAQPMPKQSASAADLDAQAPRASSGLKTFESASAGDAASRAAGSPPPRPPGRPEGPRPASSMPAIRDLTASAAGRLRRSQQLDDRLRRARARVALEIDV